MERSTENVAAHAQRTAAIGFSAPPALSRVHVPFRGSVMLLGFGAVQRGLLPLLLRHVAVMPYRITIVSPDLDLARPEVRYARHAGCRLVRMAVTPSNVDAVVGSWLQTEGRDGLLVNLSVSVSSVVVQRMCFDTNTLYVDTCTEPWEEGYLQRPLAERTNARDRYALFRMYRDYLDEHPGVGPERLATSVTTHGMNPGLVSHFVKRALLRMAADARVPVAEWPHRPSDGSGGSSSEWAALAQRLGVRVIHISECDTQQRKPDVAPREPHTFVQTWSAAGAVMETLHQGAEMGWGTHEGEQLPVDAARYETPDDLDVLMPPSPCVYFDTPGALVPVRSWAPLQGPFVGMLVTHAESLTLSSYLSRYDSDSGDLVYRPTVHYAYRPCNEAILSTQDMVGNNFKTPPADQLHVLTGDEVRDEGIDELGVLLLGPLSEGHTGYWYGSQLTAGEAKRLAPFNQATTLQVAASVLGAIVWAIRHPRRGLVEPEHMDHEEVLAVAEPYLGPVVGAYTDWTPLESEYHELYSREQTSATDNADYPFLFRHFRVGALRPACCGAPSP